MSIEFEVERDVRVPKERLYNALLDLEAAEHWMQGLVGIEQQVAGPMREGSTWIETRKMYGSKASEHFEVVELVPNGKIVIRVDGTKGTTGKGEYHFTYRIAGTGDKSNVHLHGKIGGLTGVTKLFGKMMAGPFKKATAKDLDALKDYLESNKG